MITLLADKVGITPITDPDRTPSGKIIIPDMAKERTDQGIVKYVGPKVKSLKIGDYILFSGYSGTTVQFEQDADGIAIIMRERFVNAILGNPDTEVNGLYFKAVDDNSLRKDLEKQLNECIQDGILVVSFQELVNRIIVTHFGNDLYFPATYEMAMNIIAESFRNSDFAKNTGFKYVLGSRPDVKEYDDEGDDIELDKAPLVRDNELIKPLGDRIIVKRAEAEKKVGSLYLSEYHLEKSVKGTIIAIGPGLIDKDDNLIPMESKVGDDIIFGKQSAREFMLNGIEYLTLYERDIVCVTNRIPYTPLESDI